MVPNLCLISEPGPSRVQGGTGRPRSLSNSYLTQELLCLPHRCPSLCSKRKDRDCFACLAFWYWPQGLWAAGKQLPCPWAQGDILHLL